MKGKRILALFSVGILCIGFTISCTREKEIIFDITEADMENKVENVNINSYELNLGEDGTFVPVYFEGDKVVGVQQLWKGNISHKRAKEYELGGKFKKNTYFLGQNGELSGSKEFLIDYGIFMNGERYVTSTLGIEDNNIYYIDQRRREKKKIGEVVFDSYEDGSVKNTSSYGLVRGNENFAYIESFKFGTEVKDNGTQNLNFTGLKIVNVKENKTYTYRGDNKIVFSEFVYSNLTNSFYAVENVSGEIYELKLDGEEITLIKHGKIETGIIEGEKTIVDVNESGEILFFISENDKNKNMVITYNPKNKTTKEIKSGEGRFSVERYFSKGNKLILYKVENKGIGNDRYIGEFNEQGEINILAKINAFKKDGLHSFIDNVIVSEDGNNMILIERIYDEDSVETNFAHLITFK